MFILFPWVLKTYTTAQVAYWQVLGLIFGIQVLAESGFGQSFVRAISYGYSGVEDLDGKTKTGEYKSQPNVNLLTRIFGTMQSVYNVTSTILVILIMLLGIPAVSKRISAIKLESSEYFWITPLPTEVVLWFLFFCVTISTTIAFRCGMYSAATLGLQKVTKLRKWESLVGGAGIISSYIAIRFKCSFEVFILVNQVWCVVGGVVNRWVGRKEIRDVIVNIPPKLYDPQIFNHIWLRAWRSGLGVLFSYLVVQGTGLIYAQGNDTVGIANYLLAVRLLQVISQASQAPFYSKIPEFAVDWARGAVPELVQKASQSMKLSLLAFVVPWALGGIFGPAILERLESKTPFPTNGVWTLLGISIICERYGAMHLQLYSVTDRIVWHIVNGVAGLFYSITAFVLFPKFGILGVCLSALLANLLIYSAISSSLSRRAFRLSVVDFDLKTFGPAIIVALVYLSLVVWGMVF